MPEVFAPAKINLSLRVLRRREDGFHEIDTIMAPLSLADRLLLEPMPGCGIRFSCDDPTIPAGDDNLAVRAVTAFREATGWSEGVRVRLEKRIPHGAGLGGGSSDAAAVLCALNAHIGNALPESRLREIAAGLGSDVPFFLLHGPGRCRGRGEILEPAPPLPALRVLLVKLPFGVPTAWAYRQWAASKEIPGVDYGPQKFSWGGMVNDLERPVFEKYIVLAALRQWLRVQPESDGTLLSGSGSTVFALLRREVCGETLADRVKSQFGAHCWTCLTRLRHESPASSDEISD